MRKTTVLIAALTALSTSALAAIAPPICTSAPGFDRAAFHADFHGAVAAFFGKTLAGRSNCRWPVPCSASAGSSMTVWLLRCHWRRWALVLWL